MIQTTVKVSGMACSMCEAHINDAVRGAFPVEKVISSHSKGETVILSQAPLDENAPVPSCRNADGPYHQGQYVLTVDGFLVTPNVTVERAAVVDTGFAYSDHNPVTMTFTLS